MIDGKKYTVKEQIQYEFERIKGDKSLQDGFFAKALAIQNHAWDAGFADNKLAIACEVLCLCAHCNPTMCDRCQLTAANQRAKAEIALGLRTHKKKENIEEYDDIISFTKEELLAISTACHYMNDDTNEEILSSVISKIDSILEAN